MVSNVEACQTLNQMSNMFIYYLNCIAYKNLHAAIYGSCILFIGDYCNDNGIYEDLQDFKTLKTFMDNQLEDYNMTPGVIPMELVLFRDAIEHSMSKLFFLTLTDLLHKDVVQVHY